MALEANITLFRERSVVQRLGAGNEPPVLDLRSNRVALTLKVGQRTDEVVVRGQNIPASLRLTALVAEHYERQPTLFSKENYATLDWKSLWIQRQTAYERRFQPESWVSLHNRGRVVFSTSPPDTVETIVTAIESVARGADVQENLLREAARRLTDIPIEDLVVQHESQTAVVFTPFKDYLRVAILERRDGRTSSFAISAYHSTKPGDTLGIGTFVNFCADVAEALALRALHEKVKAQLENGRSYAARVPAAQIDAAAARKRDVMRFLDGFERAHRVAWRPERPSFF